MHNEKSSRQIIVYFLLWYKKQAELWHDTKHCCLTTNPMMHWTVIPPSKLEKKLVKHAQTLAWPIGTGKKQTLLLTKPETFGKFDRLCVM